MVQRRWLEVTPAPAATGPQAPKKVRSDRRSYVWHRRCLLPDNSAIASDGYALAQRRGQFSHASSATNTGALPPTRSPLARHSDVARNIRLVDAQARSYALPVSRISLVEVSDLADLYLAANRPSYGFSDSKRRMILPTSTQVNLERSEQKRLRSRRCLYSAAHIPANCVGRSSGP